MGLLILPVVLLHAASFMFSLHDRSMHSFASRTITDSFGHWVHFHELRQPDADWNIIFIHGTPATGGIFGEQFKRPFPRANLFALDRPGFGHSGPAQKNPSLDDQANAVGALLGDGGHQRTILVGHSYGAPVALMAALKFTNQVAGVVLIGGSVDPSQERTYWIQRFADSPIVSWLLPRALRQCNRELLTLQNDLEQLQPQLRSLNLPVVMLHGAKDRQVPVANVSYLRQQFSDAGHTNLFIPMLFPAYNHFIPWEHPQAVEAALDALTNRLARLAQFP